MRSITKRLTLFGAVLAFANINTAGAAVGPVTVTLLHTNDIHSHFRSDRSALGLGGVARLATAVREERRKAPDALLIDGGDWSEGSIYYTQGAGRESLRLMDMMGYDVAVIGNHDWINGPDVLLNAVEQAAPSFRLLAANVDLSKYPRADEFRKLIPPYVIKEVRGIRIAFIGVVTYEFIYDKFFEPVKIDSPFRAIADLAARLSREADLVIAVSHNGIASNRRLLEKAPALDLVIGAHDHVKLIKPQIVARRGAPPGWIVETGKWGQYLGRLELSVDPSLPREERMWLASYRLLQIDSTIPEARDVADKIDSLDQAVKARMGAIFDEVGDSHLDLERSGIEDGIGDFTTDAYRWASGADLALDQSSFVYDGIHEGPIRTVDVFDSNPGVFNPKTGKSWTLHTVPMSGRVLNWFLNIYYAWTALSVRPIDMSGMELTFNPLFRSPQTESFSESFNYPSLLTAEFPGVIRDLKIDGQPIDKNRKYTVAVGGGIIDSFEFVNGLLFNLIPTSGIRDTGIESWRVMLAYVKKLSPLNSRNVELGNRVHTLTADLGVTVNDVHWLPSHRRGGGHEQATIDAVIRNTGATPSTGAETVDLLANANGADYSTAPEYSPLAPTRLLPVLAPGEQLSLSWSDVVMTESHGVYPVTVRINGTEQETNHTNDEATKWFSRY